MILFLQDHSNEVGISSSFLSPFPSLEVKQKLVAVWLRCLNCVLKFIHVQHCAYIHSKHCVHLCCTLCMQIHCPHHNVGTCPQTSGHAFSEESQKWQCCATPCVAVCVICLPGLFKGNQPSDSDCEMCKHNKEELEQVKEEFERYKLRAQSVLKNKHKVRQSCFMSNTFGTVYCSWKTK